MFNLSVLTIWGLFSFDLIIRLWFGARIIHRKLPASLAWAWLCMILFVPMFGTVVYLYFGEYRQSRRRQRRLLKAQETIDRVVDKILKSEKDVFIDKKSNDALLANAFQTMFGWPALNQNQIKLLRNADEVFPTLIADIDSAQYSIDLEFYIWSDGGRTYDFAESLIRAAKRGVRCRLLVDAIGSAQFIKGETYGKLRDHGIQIALALPSGFWRSIFTRPDLRVHRKIVIIDDCIGYTGSMNLADPIFFKKEAGVGQWVDAFARLQGPSVHALLGVFLSDWCAETGEDFAKNAADIKIKNKELNHVTETSAVIQCLPSGPAVKNSAIEQALIMCLYEAREEIVLTTPYFIPSESFLYALIAAARRGVKTTLIVPALVDSRLTQYASRSFFQDLIAAGVKIALYEKGLLHTKSVTIDQTYCLFGSLNLDPRSLRINYEITIAVYDSAFTKEVCDMQNSYLNDSNLFTLQDIKQETSLEMWKGDIARLIGPLL